MQAIAANEVPARRIAMIGPLPPFRGGIARHTMALARALASRTSLLVVSYTRQYPKRLYPGASDIDPAARRLAEPWSRYLLDSLDPRTWRRTLDAILAHKPDAVLIPWWTVYWAPCTAYLARGLARRNVPVHFICHNVVDHEAAAWKRELARLALKRGSGFVVQSDAERTQLATLLPGARIVVHPHPVFDRLPEPANELPRRAKLELLFFGFVRPYKGLDLLLRAMALPGAHDAMLTIAGEFWEKVERSRTLVAGLGIAERVELIDRYVDDREAAALFARADAIVLPYRAATGSGVLGLALQAGKPVIASRVPGIAEMVRDGETGILVEPGSPDALAAAIASMSAERAASMHPAIGVFAARHSFDALADAVLALTGAAFDASGSRASEFRG